MHYTKTDLCGDEAVGSYCGLSLDGTRHNLKRLYAMRECLVDESIEINKKVAIINRQIEDLEVDEWELGKDEMSEECEGWPFMCDPCDHQLDCPRASTRSQAPSPGFDQEGGML